MPSSLCASEWAVAGPSVFQALSGDRVTRIELQEVARDHLSLAGLPTSLSSIAHLLSNGSQRCHSRLRDPGRFPDALPNETRKASFWAGGSWRQPVWDRSSPCGEAATLARAPMHLDLHFPKRRQVMGGEQGWRQPFGRGLHLTLTSKSRTMRLVLDDLTIHNLVCCTVSHAR
jgi:hypothetical protein